MMTLLTWKTLAKQDTTPHLSLVALCRRQHSLSAWSPDLQFPLFATGENGNASFQQQPLARAKMGLTLWTSLLYFLATDLC